MKTYYKVVLIKKVQRGIKIDKRITEANYTTSVRMKNTTTVEYQTQKVNLNLYLTPYKNFNSY